VGVLIDTSVLVAAERSKVELKRIVQDVEQYSISTVSAAELLHGVHRSTGRQSQLRSAYVELILATFEVLPIDLIVVRACAQISAALAKSQARVNANDLWIAATANAYGLSVLAFDGDFDRIPGVIRATIPV
jgi:tRNA(fMet)-specific endonuclease VapC